MESKNISLMSVCRFAAIRRPEERAVQPIGHSACFQFFNEVGNALQYARGLVNVIANHLERRRARQDQIGMKSCLKSTADICLHGISDHDDVFQPWTKGEFL